MYLEIDEGYFEHPKTLRLCAALRDNKASIYPIRLWKWACRSARDGKLGVADAFVIEQVVGYEPMDGKCFEALCRGFIDRHDDGECEIHDWMGFTGGAIKRMEDKAAENKRRREEGKRRSEEERRRVESNKEQHGTDSVQESYQNRTSTNPTQTRPDQTRPDQSRQERDPDPERARDPVSVAPSIAVPRNEPGKPTPMHVVSMYLAIRSEIIVGAVQGAKGLFTNPQTADLAKAAEWLSGIDLGDCVDIEPAIRLACQHVRDGEDGWAKPEMAKVGFLFGAIVRSWPDLREELHGCAPKLTKTKDQHQPSQPRATYEVLR